jgi:hypothetical protein
VNKQNHLDSALELANRRQETIDSKNDTLQFKSSALSDSGQQIALLRAELSAEALARKRVERESAGAKSKIKILEDNIQTITRQSQETARDLSRTIDLLRTENQVATTQIRRSRDTIISNDPVIKSAVKNVEELDTVSGIRNK